MVQQERVELLEPRRRAVHRRACDPRELEQDAADAPNALWQPNVGRRAHARSAPGTCLKDHCQQARLLTGGVLLLQNQYVVFGLIAGAAVLAFVSLGSASGRLRPGELVGDDEFPPMIKDGKGLSPPHGGKLLDLIVSPSTAEQLKAESAHMLVHRLSQRQVRDRFRISLLARWLTRDLLWTAV